MRFREKMIRVTAYTTTAVRTIAAACSGDRNRMLRLFDDTIEETRTTRQRSIAVRDRRSKDRDPRAREDVKMLDRDIAAADRQIVSLHAARAAYIEKVGA